MIKVIQNYIIVLPPVPNVFLIDNKCLYIWRKWPSCQDKHYNRPWKLRKHFSWYI